MTGQKAQKATPRRGRRAYDYRLRRMRDQGMKPPVAGHDSAKPEHMDPDAAVECGWGRVLFGQTFSDPKRLVDALRAERPDHRDIAMYVRDPHVVLAQAPQELFLDPSHTFRLDLATYRPGRRQAQGYFVRRLTSSADAEAVNRIYAKRGMIRVPPSFFWSQRDSRSVTYFVAEDENTGDVLGTITGIDHHRAFNDPEHGSSLWCLAVDPQAPHPGIGEMLVRRLAEHFSARGAAYLDLSVLHDNDKAIGLYEKLGFTRVPFFAVKRKNPINERLFVPSDDLFGGLNPYARIIVDEALRRGIQVDVTDAEGGFFRLTYGGRSVLCRESLSEMTSGIAVSICDDKAVTRRVVERAGLRVPAQIDADAGEEALKDFLAEHGSVVVKPARGEQGRGVAVGVDTMESIYDAIDTARQMSQSVIVEECVAGHDLRLVVIDFRVVAASMRMPPRIVGDGTSSIRQLIEQLSRRRAAATGGESGVPMDRETERCVVAAGYTLNDALPEKESLEVRKTANLHTGGTIHDVTSAVHPRLVDAAIAAARAIDIPVTGIDFIVNSPREPDYHFIEANERPGLANHEPQPTAERFIDLLFPLTKPIAESHSMRRVS